VVSVSVLNFNLFPDELPFHSTFQLTEKSRPDIVLTDDCVMHYLELRKLPEGETSELAEWLYALRHLDEMEGPMMVLLKKNHNLQELADRYYRFEKDSEARMIYEARMKEMRDQAAWLDEAQTKGLALGIEKGIEKGIEQGIEQGIAQNAREVAIKLRDKGMSLAEILEVTGVDLSLE